MSDMSSGFVVGMLIGGLITAIGFMLWLVAKTDQCAQFNKTPCHIMAVVKEAK